MEGFWIDVLIEEKDFKLKMDTLLKFFKNCTNRILGFMNRNVSCKNKEVIFKQ